MAHAHLDRALRLYDCLAQLRPALDPGIFSYAAVAGERLGARRVWIGTRAAKHHLGPGAAGRGDIGGSLRYRAGAVCRRRVLCSGPRTDGVVDNAAAARHLRRHADRFRARRLFVRNRARGAGQALAGTVANARFRRRYRCRLIRAIPLCASHRVSYRHCRMARDAGPVRVCDVDDPAILVRACNAWDANAHARGRAGAVADPGIVGGFWSALVRPSRDWVFHLRISAGLYHVAFASLPRRPRAFD